MAAKGMNDVELYDRRELIARRIEAGATAPEVQKEFRCSEQTVRRACEEHGVKFPSRRQPIGERQMIARA